MYQQSLTPPTTICSARVRFPLSDPEAYHAHTSRMVHNTPISKSSSMSDSTRT